MAVSWCFEDEARPETDALQEQVRNAGRRRAGRVAPGSLATCWCRGERRGRLSAADTTTRLELIAELPIATDDEASGRGLRAVVALARTASLTTYDAAYLELAMRRGLPLATKDKALARGRPQRRTADAARLSRLSSWSSDLPRCVGFEDGEQSSHQRRVAIDYDRAADLGVTIGGIGRTLETMRTRRVNGVVVFAGRFGLASP